MQKFYVRATIFVKLFCAQINTFIAPNFQKNNIKIIYFDVFSKEILIDLGHIHVKLFNNHFYLKQNYEKQLVPILKSVHL